MRLMASVEKVVILSAFWVLDPTVPIKPSLNGTETTFAVATEGMPSASTMNTIVHTYCAMIDRMRFKFATLKMASSARPLLLADQG